MNRIIRTLVLLSVVVQPVLANMAPFDPGRNRAPVDPPAANNEPPVAPDKEEKKPEAAKDKGKKSEAKSKAK